MDEKRMMCRDDNGHFRLMPGVNIMDALDKLGVIADEFEAMRAGNGYEYAEEKLRQRASQVSGIDIKYQHESEIEAWKQMMTGNGQTAEEELGENSCGL